MNYIDWHYFEIWPKILTLWRNSILFPFYYFSIPLHLATFFSPWHRQYVTKKLGFHLDDVLGVIFFNFFTRIIGAFMRLFTILYGLLFMLVDLVIFIIPVIVWPLIPGLSLPFYFTRRLKDSDEIKYLLEVAGEDSGKLAKILFKLPEGKFILSHLDLQLIKLMRPLENDQLLNQKQNQLTASSLPELFQKLCENYLPFKTLLDTHNLKSEDVYETVLWWGKIYPQKEVPLIYDLTRIKNLQGIGHNWAYGYTVNLDKFSKDLTRVIPAFPILVRREDEIASLQRILLKTEGNNALVVGEPGVARRLLVEILAYRILTGNVEPKLAHKRILSLNMHALISAKPNVLEVKGLAEELLSEADYAGNIIIFINEIDKYLSEGSGRIDLSDVIAKFAESSVGVIGITTPFAYHKFIKNNSSLSPLFEKVDVEALDKEGVLDVLEVSIAPVLEKKYGITVTYPAIVKTIKDSEQYITDTPFPSKAIELLDQSCVYLTAKKKERVLLAKHIDDYLSKKMNMPLGDLQKEEAGKLSNLENLLHEKIINQEEAIRVISASLRRARMNVSNVSKPIGTFLFLGPTGVGKTETAKALASVYFGSKEKLNRFDMSQYQGGEGIERLIGSIKLGTAGEMTSKISDRPFSILLLDEFEKADRQIFNLFLTLLDEGYISDAAGKKISAKNNIIIATSNAGGEFIRERLQQGLQGNALQKELLEYVQTEKIFSPELLNRFDAVVVFTPLSEGHLREVAKLMLDDLNKRLEPKEISVQVTQDLIKKLASIGFDPQFGGRAMKRVITEKIEDQVAQKLLRDEVKKGEQIQIQL